MLIDRHHIIPKHEWKERFGNLVGVNAPDNLAFLTREQHIECHRWLYEHFGRWKDLMAVNGMRGGLSKKEISREIARFTNIGNKNHLGKPHSNETRLNMRLSHKRPWLGKRHSLQTIEKCRISKMGELNPMFGKKMSDETRAKMKLSQQQRRERERKLNI